MKRINVRRMLGLLACAFMLISSTLGGAATVARAEETTEVAVEGGGLHFANGYDWRDAGDGHAHNIFAFASTDATATSGTFTGQAVGFFNWWYGFVLEYNAEKGTYVVTVADMVASDGVNAAETATLGEGKIVVAFHDGAAENQAYSFNYFLENVKEGAEFTLSCDFATLAAAAGALTDVTLTLVETEEAQTAGGLHFANGYDWRDAGDGHAHNIFAFASADATATSSTFTGQGAGFFNWWYGFVLEYNAEKGTYVVTVADMVASDGVCAAETATLGEGKIVVVFHDGAAENQADSFNYFLANVKEGAEFTLSCDFATLAAAAGALTDVTLTVVEKEAVAAGGLHFANGYDWRDAGDGHAHNIFVFASADATATSSTFTGQGAGFFNWWYGFVLEYNAEKGTYVVTVADMVPGDGVCAAETATLGEGKIVVAFHDGVAENQADSFNFFLENVKEGAEFTLSCDFATLAAAAGALTDVTLTLATAGTDAPVDVPEEPTPTPEPLPESTIGYLTMSNAYDWLDDHIKEIIVLTSDDPELQATAVLGQDPANNVFGWWYGLVLEYNEEKGVFVVTSSDMNPDGVLTVESEKLGYGKMVIMFYPDVVGKHPETVAYLTTHAEVGTEHYLVGNYDDMIWVYDKLADTYLTSEKPETYWTKSDATPTPEPTPEPTAEPTAEPTQAPEPVVQENPGMSPVVIAVIVVAVVALAGVIVVVIKKRK
ncbi:MAG: hypothetical protein E7260_12770 [Lachnospiraceae bacterium]|nr:hypothetical protein [Lachnospiraceae bacterium]